MEDKTDGIISEQTMKMTVPISDASRSDLVRLQMDLAESLPPHMVPSVYITLQEMPLSTAAKFDRDRLRQIAAEL